MKKLIIGFASLFNAIVLYGFCILSTSLVVAAREGSRFTEFTHIFGNMFLIPFLLVLLLGLIGVIFIISEVRESKEYDAIKKNYFK